MLNEIKKDAQARMGKSIESLRHNLVKVRTGRASTGLVDSIRVVAYGSEVPLSQVASVAVSDARSLVITPWDKTVVGAVEKAILASDLGLTPNTAGTTIRLNLPPLTEERRKEYVRLVKNKAEDSRNAVRGARRDARKDLDALEKDGDISADELRRAEGELDKLTKQHEAAIDEALEAKTVELLEG